MKVNSKIIISFGGLAWKYLVTVFGKDNLEYFFNKGYKLLISGRINDLPGDLPEICNNAIDKTKFNSNGILNICINFFVQDFVCLN